MPSTHLGYRVLTLSVLICVCSSTVAASVGVGYRTANPTTGCFPSVDSVERGETVGDVVDVEMLLCFTGSVTIQGPEYRGKATLGDGNHSGHITLNLNTTVTDSAVLNVTSEQLDSVPLNTTGDGSFEPGTYTVRVRDGGGDLADTVNFKLSGSQSQTPNATRDARADDVTVYRSSNTSFEGVEAIDGAIKNGIVEPANNVSVGDTLVMLSSPSGSPPR